MNGRNALIGALQVLRARGAHHDSAAGQVDMQHALLVVDAYCNEQKNLAMSDFSRAHFAALVVAISQLEAGDHEGALRMLRAVVAKHWAEGKKAC
jgi:hypothetical protein